MNARKDAPTMAKKKEMKMLERKPGDGYTGVTQWCSL